MKRRLSTKRPTAATWRLDRSKPLAETVAEATRRVMTVYGDALEALAGSGKVVDG